MLRRLAAICAFGFIFAGSVNADSGFNQVSVAPSAPTGTEASFLSVIQSQFMGTITPNPLASNTYAIRLLGPNPAYQAPAPPPSTLEQALELGTTLYNYGFRDGQAEERYQNLFLLESHLGTAIDSTTVQAIYDSINDRSFSDPPTPQLP